MSRHLRSILPTTSNQLIPKIIELSQASEQFKKEQLTHKKCYDQYSRPLSELKSKDSVYMQADNCWIPATVIWKVNTPHSYIVKTTDGHIYHWNYRHLKTSQTQGQWSAHKATSISTGDLNNDHQSDTTPAESSQSVTSGGWPVKTPTRFQDYVRL